MTINVKDTHAKSLKSTQSSVSGKTFFKVFESIRLLPVTTDKA